MSELMVLSNDLNVITVEINSYKHMAGQAIVEIGRRLKHVKENDLAHGEWYKWLETIDVTPTTATRMIQAADQFGKHATSHGLSAGKIFEMLSLPDSIDRAEFLGTTRQHANRFIRIYERFSSGTSMFQLGVAQLDLLVGIPDAIGRAQNTTVVSEAGLYRLIFICVFVL